MREERKETLQKLCLVFRSKLIDLLYSIQTGHPGGSLSCTEILTALYYELMDVDPMNPEKEDVAGGSCGRIVWHCCSWTLPQSGR